MVTHKSGKRIRSMMLIFSVVIMSGCASNPVVADGDSKGIKGFYGVYQVTSVERYRGGLTSEDEARELIGTSAVIADDKFVYREKDVTDPVYKVECVPANLGEGNVDSRGLSNFYGFLTDRKEICLLHVSNSSGRFIWEFEIINSETLWDLYDGWIFKLMKTS